MSPDPLRSVSEALGAAHRALEAHSDHVTLAARAAARDLEAQRVSSRVTQPIPPSPPTGDIPPGGGPASGA